MCLLIDSRLGLQPTAHSSWSVNSLSYMLMDLLYKWPAPEMPEKNSSVQHTNKQICVHIAPAVLFVSQPQLEMHFDDSQFYFFPHIFKNVCYAQHWFLSWNLWRLLQYNAEWKCLKKSQVTLIKYWLYVLFSWFNKPLVMQQCYSPCSYWTYLPPKVFLPPACL